MDKFFSENYGNFHEKLQEEEFERYQNERKIIDYYSAHT